VPAGAPSSMSSSSSGTPSHSTWALCVQAPPAWSNTSPGCSSLISHRSWAPCQRPCKRGGRANSCRRLRESAAAARARWPYPRRPHKLRPASVRVRSGRASSVPAAVRASRPSPWRCANSGRCQHETTAAGARQASSRRTWRQASSDRGQTSTALSGHARGGIRPTSGDEDKGARDLGG
jgi:hypothetical protein